MTENSYLCKIIADAEGDEGYWMSILENDHHGITWKIEGPLVIFNYGIEADFYDPVVREARGIIINKETAEVVCWPFTKFGKYDEGYASSIDWSTARVQEKIDGSIVKLWFNKLTNEWQFSTNSMFDARKVIMQTYGVVEYNNTFYDLITQATNYNQIYWNSLDKDYTYIFELIGPGNRVVIPYENYFLYHTGTRSNLTGEEISVFIGISHPREFWLHSLDECIDYVANEFNNNASKVITSCDHEGFVVVDSHWNRIKVKSPIYMLIHSILNNSFVAKNKLVELLFDDRIDTRQLSIDYPGLASTFKWYDYQVARFKYEASSLMNIARRLDKLCNGDRKEIASRMKDERLKPVAFIALDNPDMTIEQFYEYWGIKKITRWIPDYPKTHYGNMFNGLYGDKEE